jgi:hypothetical protein
MVPGRGIEDDDEYIVSKCLLLGVINSVMITNCFTKDTILALNDFLQTRILFTKQIMLPTNIQLCSIKKLIQIHLMNVLTMVSRTAVTGYTGKIHLHQPQRKWENTTEDGSVRDL